MPVVQIWEFDTQKCGTLYISLEDTIDRLHLRLSRITEHGFSYSEPVIEFRVKYVE